MEQFLRKILPDGGDYTVLALRKGAPHEVNGIKTISDLAADLSQMAAGSPADLYVAVAAYTGKRLAANARAKRCLALDLDAKDFGDKASAEAELGRFCRTVGIPFPSTIVDSGGGLHAYWPFDRDLPPAEWKALAECLKARCASADFPADPTVTADLARVLRVPGTLNHKYNPPVPCTVVKDSGELFDPAQLFRQLQDTQIAIPVSAIKRDVSMNSDLEGGTEYRIFTAAEVGSMLAVVSIPADGSERRHQWLRIMQAVHNWSGGNDEGFGLVEAWSAGQPAYQGAASVRKIWDSFTGGSGKQITIGTLVKLARESGWTDTPPDVDDDQDGEVLVPALQTAGIVSAAIGDDRRKELATRGAKRLSPQDAVNELTSDFIYVENQGTYYSESRRNILDKLVIQDLYSWKMPQTKGGTQDPCKMLRESYKTRQVHSMGFHPGEGAIYSEAGKSYVNRYTKPADEIKPTAAEIALFKDFVGYLFPRPEDQTFKNYWLQFLGHLVQKPGVKIATALLFVSETYGIGKTTAAYEIPRLLAGPANTRSISNDILSRPFTAYLGESHLLHLSEVHVNGLWNSSEIANRLKTIITDSTVNVHRKGFDDYDIPNRVAVTATSNYQDAMYISSLQERRWGIYELTPARGYTEEQHRKYFDVIHRFLADPRAQGVLRYIFGRVSLKGFNPQTPPPMTLAKERMQVLSLAEDAQVVYDAFGAGMKPFHKDVFQVEDVRALVEAELKKVISSKRAASIVTKVIPDAKALGHIRHGANYLRPWACRNTSLWMNSAADLVRQELAKP